MSLEIGSKIPDVTVYNFDRKPVKLSEFAGKNLLIAFFPGAYTGVCTNEICTLQDAAAMFNNFNTDVIGITVDSTFSNKSWVERNMISFPVFSDYLRAAVNAFGIELPDFAGLPGYNVAKRSVFLVDKNQVVINKWVLENPGNEPPYQEIEKAVEEMNK